MRTIKEIKQQMTEAFVAHPEVRKAYGLTRGRSFAEQFSRVSLESILMYVVASALWLVEAMVEEHRREIDELIRDLKPHSLRWYARMARAYMHGHQLTPDTDRYDLEGLTPAEQERARLVRYAVATEDATVVYLKVAGADPLGQPVPLEPSVFSGLGGYIAEVKDAGVAVELINQPADSIQLELDLYLPTHLLAQTQTIEERVAVAIRGALSALPFDGLLRLSALVSALEALPEVEVASILRATTKPHRAQDWTTIEGYHRPYAGYWRLDSLTIRYKPYNSYDRL